MEITQNFPADGEYRFSMSFDEQSIGLYNRGLQNRTTLVMMIDGDGCRPLLTQTRLVTPSGGLPIVFCLFLRNPWRKGQLQVIR